MLYIVFLLLSCVKKPDLNSATIRDYFGDTNDCVATLEQGLHESDCPMVRHYKTSEYDIILRCDKLDRKRGEFWDNYVFRISPTSIDYSYAEDREFVRKHTVCVDRLMRVEAYPPNVVNIKTGN